MAGAQRRYDLGEGRKLAGHRRYLLRFRASPGISHRPGSNSGIFLRAGRTGNPAFSGMELQILSDAGKPADVHSTGSLYGAVAPTKNMAKPDGEWNQVEITAIKREVTAIWNGEKILDVQLDDPKYHKRAGAPAGGAAAVRPHRLAGLLHRNTGRIPEHSRQGHQGRTQFQPG